MIDSTDMESIDKEHFKIVEKKEYTIVLRSKNTGHYWCLLEQVYNNHRTFRISHRHKESAPYHFQRNKPTVAECCGYIKSHDAYQLAKEHKKAERQQRRQEEKRKKKEPSLDDDPGRALFDPDIVEGLWCLRIYSF